MQNKMRKLLLTLCLTAALPVGTLLAANEPASLDADTVEYDMKSGLAIATGDVLMKQRNAKVTGAKATYNSKTQEGTVEGNVIAVRDDLRVTCDKVVSDGQGHMSATGNVHGVQGQKTFTGEHVDYYPNQNKYVKIPTGGTITDGGDTFTADYMEGWLDDEHYIGKGNVHVNSPSRKMEAGGDHADYVGKEQGRVIMTGNAWAIQENNTMKSNKLTLYLDPNGRAKVK